MLKKKLQGNFTITDNRIAQSDRLSLEARGLYHYMSSLPDDWEYSEQRLANNAGCSVDRIKRILGELFSIGLLERGFYNNAQGHRKSIYTLFDFDTIPTKENPTLENPTLENPMYKKEINKQRTKINKELNTQSAREACAGGGGDLANALPLKATAEQNSVVEPMPKELKRPATHVSVSNSNGYARLCSQLGAPYDREQERMFGEFWNLYPRKTNQIKALESFLGALSRGVGVSHILEQLKRFKRLLEYRKTTIDKVPFASTWLDSERYNDDLESELAQYERPEREIIITPAQVWERAMRELPAPSADITHAELAGKPAILRAYKGMKLYAGGKLHTLADIGLGKGDSLPAGYLIAITLRDESGAESAFKFYALNQLEAFMRDFKI